MTSITLDTNCINARNNDKTLNILESMHKNGKIKIYKTDVMDTEMQNHYNPGLQKSEEYEEDIGVIVPNHSRLNHGILGNGEEDDNLSQLLEILFGKKRRQDYSKNEIRDAMMLETHKKSKRDILVTNDAGILNKGDVLKEKFNIIVMSPQKCLETIKTATTTAL